MALQNGCDPFTEFRTSCQLELRFFQKIRAFLDFKDNVKREIVVRAKCQLLLKSHVRSQSHATSMMDSQSEHSEKE